MFKACYKATDWPVEGLGQILQIHGYILQKGLKEMHVQGFYSGKTT